MGRHAKRAKRVYCEPCGGWHSPPTGQKCAKQMQDPSDVETADETNLPSEPEATSDEKEAKSQGVSPTRRSRRIMAISGREGQEMSSVQPKWSKSALQKRREVESSDSELMFSDSDQHNGNGRTLQLIVEQMQAISVQQQEARRADRAEMRAAIANLAAKIEPQQISDEEEHRPTKRRATTAKKAQAFALPVASHRKAPVSRTATTPRAWQAAMDPIARIRADEASHAQAQLLLQTRTHLQDPDSEIKSGYYRTLTDNQKYEVPWPCDTVYRANGKRATFDSMSMSEFVQGYLHIIATSLPLNEDTAAAYDHIAYLCDLMADAQHSDWSLVKNSHRQILHMVEQGQITWECAEARNTA